MHLVLLFSGLYYLLKHFVNLLPMKRDKPKAKLFTLLSNSNPSLFWPNHVQSLKKPRTMNVHHGRRVVSAPLHQHKGTCSAEEQQGAVFMEIPRLLFRWCQ